MPFRVFGDRVQPEHAVALVRQHVGQQQVAPSGAPVERQLRKDLLDVRPRALDEHRVADEDERQASRRPTGSRKIRTRVTSTSSSAQPLTGTDPDTAGAFSAGVSNEPWGTDDAVPA